MKANRSKTAENQLSNLISCSGYYHEKNQFFLNHQDYYGNIFCINNKFRYFQPRLEFYYLKVKWRKLLLSVRI